MLHGYAHYLDSESPLRGLLDDFVRHGSDVLQYFATEIQIGQRGGGKTFYHEIQCHLLELFDVGEPYGKGAVVGQHNQYHHVDDLLCRYDDVRNVVFVAELQHLRVHLHDIEVRTFDSEPRFKNRLKGAKIVFFGYAILYKLNVDYATQLNRRIVHIIAKFMIFVKYAVMRTQ